MEETVIQMSPSTCFLQYPWLLFQPGSAPLIQIDFSPLKQQYPTVLAPGTGFMEDSFSMDGSGRGRGMVQVVTQVMGSNGEQQTKLCLFARCSPPALQPSSPALV